MNQDVHVCTSTYYLNSGILSYCLVLFWIHGGTRRYKAVPESPVPLDMQVQGGTSRYKALYLHVLPCTCISRGTGLSGTAMYLIVPISLPCTALYCHVSRRGQEDTRRYDSVPEWTSWYVPVCIRLFQQDFCVGNMCSTCWYVPVHTSTNQYIPGHTSTYQYIPVRTATSTY